MPSDWPDVLSWYGRRAVPGERVTLDASESRHVAHVLRRRVGDAVTLADGAGSWLKGRIHVAGAKAVQVDVDDVVPAPTETGRRVELAFPPLRPTRTDWLLEKGTELGVTRFVPIRTRRARPGGTRPDRWSRIVRAAAMQCLRSTPPEVVDVIDLSEWISGIDPSLARYVGRPGGTGAVDPRRDVALIVGPEGDFDAAEWAELASGGFASVDLGPRRLRSETAALALVGFTVGTTGNR